MVVCLLCGLTEINCFQHMPLLFLPVGDLNCMGVDQPNVAFAYQWYAGHCIQLCGL